MAAESWTDGLTDNTHIYANLFGRLLQILHHENWKIITRVKGSWLYSVYWTPMLEKIFWNHLSWTISSSQLSSMPPATSPNLWFYSHLSLGGMQFDLWSLDGVSDCFVYLHQFFAFLATTMPVNVKASTSKMTRIWAVMTGRSWMTVCRQLWCKPNQYRYRQWYSNWFRPGCWCLPVYAGQVASSFPDENRQGDCLDRF